ncbi:hypothetical protein scyTo_0018819 [Scyliorhinus torazame]|uniref:Uncharacterized protein n=1 Tax=Scyliorhinus torazame TaxID=75743 RepID=A0A401Q3D3_SCYTO|nr:hypothetical protein [Scyliorhinus torazame]
MEFNRLHSVSAWIELWLRSGSPGVRWLWFSLTPFAPLMTALDIRHSVSGGKNIHVATAHEDLAYPYAHQSGKFDIALFHAEHAIDIITQPP